jgi:hypothetical protein
MRTAALTSLGALVISALVRTASAQSASMMATATVARPLAASSVRHLDFGSVFAGISKHVAYDATASGKMLVNGAPGAEVSFTFTLPDALTAGDNALPIGNWSGCHSTTDVTGACTPFTPSSSPTAARLDAGAGTLYLFIGATVSPAVVQLQGAYTATITVMAAYTGV